MAARRAATPPATCGSGPDRGTSIEVPCAPAKAGAQSHGRQRLQSWAPAFAGAQGTGPIDIQFRLNRKPPFAQPPEPNVDTAYRVSAIAWACSPPPSYMRSGASSPTEIGRASCREGVGQYV